MDDAPDTSMVIVKVCAMLLIGVVLLSGVGGIAANTHDTATITLNGNPQDGDTVTLDSHVFEFDTGNGVSAGHIAVIIGNTLDVTMANLATAIQTQEDYKVI